MSLLDYYFYKSSYEVNKSNDSVEVVVDLPGYSKKDISIKIKEKSRDLRIKTNDSEKELSFYISNVVDLSNISAELKYGQLKIKLPYTKEYLKEINVKIT